jgi:alkylhydroperoxidase/carboxymuconolactone decarboxylase family protein YurZ
MVFPIGASNDAFAQYFIGQSYLAPISTEQVGVFNVTFESGCRNNWHIHQADKGGGQILVCVAGLSYAEREMITFCFLSAQGGCEPQLTSHAAANMRNGNDKLFLIKIISHCLPFIGYPRSLNALRCVNEAVKNMENA